MVIDFNVTIGHFPEGKKIGHEDILKIIVQIISEIADIFFLLIR